jgi:hypothetical protein
MFKVWRLMARVTGGWWDVDWPAKWMKPKTPRKPFWRCESSRPRVRYVGQCLAEYETRSLKKDATAVQIIQPLDEKYALRLMIENLSLDLNIVMTQIAFIDEVESK